MRRKRGWTGLRPTVLALGFVAATAGGVRAANIPPTTPVLAYNTVGSGIDNSDTVGGTPTISFTPLLGSSFLAPSSLSFGKFLVSALPDGQTTTYSNTPFHIKLNATAVDGSAPDPNGTPLAITGKLNGSVIGSTAAQGPSQGQAGRIGAVLGVGFVGDRRRVCRPTNQPASMPGRPDPTATEG